MSNTKHTPGTLALIIGKDGCVIHSPMHGCVATVKHDNNPYKEEHEANAERIVRCWNSHDELLEALMWITNVANGKAGDKTKFIELRFERQALLSWVSDAKAAIKKATDE